MNFAAAASSAVNPAPSSGSDSLIKESSATAKSSSSNLTLSIFSSISSKEKVGFSGIFSAALSFVSAAAQTVDFSVSFSLPDIVCSPAGRSSLTACDKSSLKSEKKPMLICSSDHSFISLYVEQVRYPP